jgi:hypothetical protein
MKQTRLALIGVAALMAFGVSTAEAAITCSIHKSMCADIDRADKQVDKHNGRDQAPTSVPEPATLMLLGAGVTAVGAAVARRRKNKKD